MAAQKFTIDETMRGQTIGGPNGTWLAGIQVLNRGSNAYVMPQRTTVGGDFFAGSVLQIRPTLGLKRDLWCADLSTTQWGGSIGRSFGSTLMSGAIRFEGALTIVHCPPLPASFEITIDDAYPRQSPIPKRSKHRINRAGAAVASGKTKGSAVRA